MKEHSSEELMPIVYDELRKLARHKLGNEKADQTLSATALVHEAYVRINQTDKEPLWDSQGHFFAAAAESMRRILVDKARRKQRVKHGGDRARIHMDSETIVDFEPSEKNNSGIDLVELDKALEILDQEDQPSSQLVKLRFFAGLTMPQAAKVLGVSLRTAQRNWAYAKARLFQILAQE